MKRQLSRRLRSLSANELKSASGGCFPGGPPMGPPGFAPPPPGIGGPMPFFPQPGFGGGAPIPFGVSTGPGGQPIGLVPPGQAPFGGLGGVPGATPGFGGVGTGVGVGTGGLPLGFF